MNGHYWGNWKSTKPYPACGVRFTCSFCGAREEVWQEARVSVWANGDGTNHETHHNALPEHRPPSGWLYETQAGRPHRYWCSSCSGPVQDYRARLRAWEKEYDGVAASWPWRLFPRIARAARDTWQLDNPKPEHPYQKLCE
jgi:hypothetical protein